METKPGWKTSEFWAKIIAIGTTIYGSVSGSIPFKAQAVIAGLAAIYTIARTTLKSLGVKANLPEVNLPAATPK